MQKQGMLMVVISCVPTGSVYMFTKSLASASASTQRNIPASSPEGKIMPSSFPRVALRSEH